MNTPYQPPLALHWNRLACDAIYYTKTPPHPRCTCARDGAYRHVRCLDELREEQLRQRHDFLYKTDFRTLS